MALYMLKKSSCVYFHNSLSDQFNRKQFLSLCSVVTVFSGLVSFHLMFTLFFSLLFFGFEQFHMYCTCENAVKLNFTDRMKLSCVFLWKLEIFKSQK